jgi:uncharacterized cupin superfamily protein
MQRFNVFDGELEPPDAEDPPGYRARYARFGPAIGARGLGGTVYELAPGESICPYHWEAGDEELLIVLAGRPTVRRVGGEERLAPGDAVCFPEGPDGAHKVSNGAAEEVTARVLMLSTMRMPAIAVYPDSGKVGAFTSGEPRLRLLFREADAVDYYDGESDASER